jgi:hypothetical protein
MASVFKVRDKLSGTYWDGDIRWSKFNDKGKVYKSRATAEKAVSYLINYRSNFPKMNLELNTENWEIVEYEVAYTENKIHSIEEYMKHCKLKTEIAKIDQTCGYFMDKMYRMDKASEVQFLFKLKPSDGKRYIDFERIKEGRAHLRQLGVKTHSFKESRGVFGMLNREQAMRARLTLDVDKVIDVAEIRERLGL